MYRKNFKQRPKGHSPGLYMAFLALISNHYQRTVGHQMLLAPWAKFMGHFFDMKFSFLGCIGTTRNLENQSQNPHWAICLPAIGLRVQPLQEIQSDFAKFACVTKMLLVHSNMDGFQILKILLVAFIRAYHMRQ